jgi:hypothetical protein
LKKPNREKNPLKPIKNLKKPTGSIWFYKPKTKKIKPKPEKPEKKMSQTGKKLSQNRAKPKKPKLIVSNRFRFFF